MANNDFDRLIRDTGTTPLTSGVNAVRNPIPEAINNVADYVGKKAESSLIDKAIRQGQADGDSGNIKDIKPITSWDEAYIKSAENAFEARSNMELEQALNDLSIEHQYDIEGFKLAAQEAKTKAIMGTKSEYAVTLEQKWDAKIGRQLHRIAQATLKLENQKNVEDIETRVKSLQGLLEDKASRGLLNSPDAIEASQELAKLREGMVANPLFKYSKAELEKDTKSGNAMLAVLGVGAGVTATYDKEIASGMTLYEAEANATKAFQDAFNNNPELQGLGTLEKERLLNAGKLALKKHISIAHDDEMAKRQEDREAEKALNEKQKARSDDLWRIADTGGISEAAILKEEAAGNINMNQAKGLIGTLRAGINRRETDARQARAAERTAAAAERTARNSSRHDASLQRHSDGSIFGDLMDLTNESPDDAISQARVRKQNGQITQAQYDAIERHAREEISHDDKTRIKEMRKNLKSYGYSEEEIIRRTDTFKNEMKKNPNLTNEQRDKWIDVFMTSQAKGATSRPPPRKKPEATNIDKERNKASEYDDALAKAKAAAKAARDAAKRKL